MTAHSYHISDQSGMNHLHPFDILLVIHSLHTKVEYFFRLVVSVIDSLALVKGACHCFFTEDMFAGS